MKSVLKALSVLFAVAIVLAMAAGPADAQAPIQKPNIILILSDDFGYGDMGAYGGGAGRGMPTPSLDRISAEGMTFFHNYGQPSCTPRRAAVQTGRIPNRSGMTTVAFQGQGGGLPAAEWTLASVLKQGGYNTFFTGKWHLGEADYALPTAQGYDEMRYVGLYHLNAYTYADPKWFPTMPAELRAMYQKVTKGMLSGTPGKTVEEFKLNGEYVNTPVIDGKPGVVGIPYVDQYIETAATEYLDQAAKAGKPFFMSVNFMKVHQPNIPHPDFIGKSISKSKYADSLVENDTRIGRVMDKVRALGLDKNTYVFWTTDNGAWQDVYPDAGYTPFRGTKGTVREGGTRVPALAWGPGIKAGTKNHEIVGGLDYMATFAAMAGVKLPEKDRAGEPIIFDSYNIAPVLFGTGESPRDLVLLYRERAVTRRDPLAPVQVRVQPARRRRGSHRRTRGGYQPRLERSGEVCRHDAADLRPASGPPGALRHLHEQLHRKHLDGSSHGRADHQGDEDLPPVPATQAAERWLYRTDHDHELPEVRVAS